MLNSQELCGLRICWLSPGHFCPESKLGLNEYSQRNVIARFANGSAPVCRRLSHDEVLQVMLCGRQYFLSACLANDPLVEVLNPVSVFEFEAADIPGSRLAPSISEHGAATLFSEHLSELEETGRELARRGMAVNRGRWGVFVYCHTLWIYPALVREGHLPLPLTLAGRVDLYRFPLAMFAERVEPRNKPAFVTAGPPFQN